MRQVFASFAAVLLVWQAFGDAALQTTEYQIKAAFLYNFAKFSEWPAQTFPNENAPIYIGVLGDDPFENNLELTVSGKQINNRPFVIKRFASGKKIDFCHILFVSRSEKRDWPRILDALKDSATLTVGDGLEQFCQQGGMVNLIMVGKNVRFEINQQAAERAGLRISSRLLQLGAGKASPPNRN